MTIKSFELWTEGYAATGEGGPATHHATVKGIDFNDAVRNYVNTLSAYDTAYWRFNSQSKQWTMWGCRAFDNEADARRSFG